MIVKINLEKSYDRVDWEFLEEVLREVGFATRLVQVILNCIKSTHISTIWNGDRLQEFQPQRGLRQGDPLSPYLFVLCMEALNSLIHGAVDRKEWKPCKASRLGPPITHIFFANDLLLIGEVSISQAVVMKNVLRTFCEFSGQKVNLHKSRIWYTPNTSSQLVSTITS